MSLATCIPSIVVSGLQVPRPTVTTATAPYSPGILPPLNKVPYYILHDATLPSRMMQSLDAYLAAAPGASQAPSSYLQSMLDFLETQVSRTTIDNEASTTRLFHLLFQLFGGAVKEVDQNASFPIITKANRRFSQMPDTLVCAHADADPALHWEDKSSEVFDRHAPNILAMGKQIQEDGGRGSYLNLNHTETHHRSIIFKVSTHISLPSF
jgi:hypothetical protein